MAAAAFNLVFDRLGFHAHARALIVAEGYDDFDTIGELRDDDIDRMVSKLSKNYPPNPAQGNQDPNRNRKFPTRAVVNLKALAYWIRERIRIGGAVDPQEFTAVVLANVREQIQDDLLLVQSKKGQELTKPLPLKSWSDWPKFKNLFLTY